MNNSEIFGLIKFFDNDDFLSQLCNGTFYCNTPECYRLHTKQGVSDPYECCSWSFRKTRGDAGAKIVVGGNTIEGLNNITCRATGMKDSWLHCWTLLEFSQDEAEVESLVNDLQRIRNEFGSNYAYMLPSNIWPFFNHLKTLTQHKVSAIRVTYSSKPNEWSPICKSMDYQYQREFRFLIGECQELTTDPLIIQNQKGFSDFILKDAGIAIQNINGKTFVL
jgi:hypothetical protein